MEIDRQHIVAELQCELCCCPEGKIEVKQLDVVRKKENESSLFRSDGF